MDLEGGGSLAIVGLPFDGAVLGRKGCAGGPTGVREAFRWLGTDGMPAPLTLQWQDLGDVRVGGTVHQAHAAATDALTPIFAAHSAVVILGGDNSLSYATVAALANATNAKAGTIGLVVIDAHYDLRSYVGEPTSGTPFRRILEELPGAPVAAAHLVEVGIRPYANSAALATFAHTKGITIIGRDLVRVMTPEALTSAVLEHMSGVQHIFLSVDIDAFDQSIASGCSAPSPDGLQLHEIIPLVAAIGRDSRTRGMEIMETAPNLDPTGNTCRTAAALVIHFVAATAERENTSDTNR